MRKQTRWIWLLISLLTMTSLACSLTNLIDQAAGNQEPSTPGESGGAQGQTGGGVGGNGEVSGNLENLQSFTSTLVVNLEGKTSAGAKVNQSMNLLRQVVASQNASRFTLNISGDATAFTPMEVIEIAGQSYVIGLSGAESECILTTNEEANLAGSFGDLLPENFLGNYETDRLVKSGEVVNGITTDHYRLKRGSLNFGAAEVKKGDIWIAQQGGYVVRYTGEAEGKASLFFDTGEFDQAAISWEYNLTDVDSLASIELPDLCKQAAEKVADIPVPFNAYNKSSYSGVIAFLSNDTVGGVAEFYRAEFASGGWKTNESVTTDNLVMIAASRDNKIIQVTITKNNEGITSVIITPQ